MQQKNILSVVLFVVSIECFRTVHGRSYNNGLIFYDLKTFRPYLPPTVSVSRGRDLASVKFSDKGSIWSTFGKPCECRSSVCGCCAGINVKQYNFDQSICANVSFVPPSEEALLEVYLNEKPSSKYGISVRNPSPFCIPVMMGIPMAMCVQMSDITIKGNNLNMCMDFIVRLATADLFEMHFQCMQMGLDGFQYIDKDGKPVIPPSNSKISIDDDYYEYEEDENEIADGANEQTDEDAAASQQPTKILDSTFIIGLQQQMQQLQDAQHVKIEQDDLVTQINEATTLLPIVGDAKTEIIAAITEAYGTSATVTATENDTDTEKEKETDSKRKTGVNVNNVAAKPQTETETENEDEIESQTDSETETETDTETLTKIETETKIASYTTSTVNPINNEVGYDAVLSNNYNELPATAAGTTEAAINKPISAPINLYMDATTPKNAVVATVGVVQSEIVNTTNASNELNATDFDNDIETTPIAEDDPISAFIDAPVDPTAAVAIEAATQNSTASMQTPIVTMPLQYTQGTSTNVTKASVDLHANEKHGAPPITVATPEVPVSTSNMKAMYRQFYSWLWR